MSSRNNYLLRARAQKSSSPLWPEGNVPHAGANKWLHVAPACCLAWPQLLANANKGAGAPSATGHIRGGLTASASTTDLLGDVLGNLPPVHAPNPRRFRRARTELPRSSTSSAQRLSRRLHHAATLGPMTAAIHAPPPGPAAAAPAFQPWMAAPGLPPAALVPHPLPAPFFALWPWGAAAAAAAPPPTAPYAAAWPVLIPALLPAPGLHAPPPPQQAPRGCCADAMQLGGCRSSFSSSSSCSSALLDAALLGTAVSLSDWASASLAALQGQREARATASLAHSFEHLEGQDLAMHGSDDDDEEEDGRSTASSASVCHAFGRPAFLDSPLLQVDAAIRAAREPAAPAPLGGAAAAAADDVAGDVAALLLLAHSEVDKRGGGAAALQLLERGGSVSSTGGSSAMDSQELLGLAQAVVAGPASGWGNGAAAGVSPPPPPPRAS